MNFRRPIESKGIELSWCNLRFEATIYNYSLLNPIFNGLNLYAIKRKIRHPLPPLVLPAKRVLFLWYSNRRAMPYKILADFTLLIHFLWILCLFFGAYVGARVRGLRILHLSGLAFALIIQVFGWYCPLTYLEVWLRSMHDPRLPYTGSFIIHYVEKIVYLDLSRTLIVIGTVMLVGFNLWFYLGRNRRRE